MNAKSFLRSKTFWIQVAALASMAVPQVREWLEKNPEQFVGVFAAINVLVRFITSGKITVFGEDDAGKQGPSGGVALIVGIATAAGFLGSLPSCAPGANYSVDFHAVPGPDGKPTGAITIHASK